MLPRSKSRPLTVDGIGYRWLISDSKTDADAVLMVQRADGTESRLEVELLFEWDGHYWLPIPEIRGPKPLSNPLVTLLMNHAAKAGWLANESDTTPFRYPKGEGI